MTAKKRLTKAQRDHAAQLARQRRRAYKPDADQADRNAIGAALCRALLTSHREYARRRAAT
jgi:hypothetical protein